MKLSIHSWLFVVAVAFPLVVRAEDDPLAQEEPTAPPTSQFQGPESGYIVPIPEGNGPQINQDRVVDFNYCYSALGSHDIDGNQRLNRAEFENFAQDFGGATECLGQLEEVPIELLTVWNQLSCECVARGGESSCCLGDAANVPITGINANDQFIVSEQQYLRQVCLRTDQAIVTYCGPPPPPIIPPPPPAVFMVAAPAAAEPTGLIVGLIFLVLFLILPWRRRWIFFAGGKDEEEESSESEDESEDGGGMRHVVTETPPVPEEEPPVALASTPDVEEGERAEPDDDAMQLRAVGEEEEGEFGGTSYGRTVEEPEYEEEGDPKKFVYEQYELPAEPEVPIALMPIPPKEKEEEDEPYDLEHYVPDGGIVEYEREGEWRYDADGGWIPEERPDKDPSEWDQKPYDRLQSEEPAPVDNTRQRHLEAYGAGEIFDRLEQDQPETGGGPAIDMFDWVIQTTLNTLDERGDDLQGSIHSSDDSSKGSSKQ